MKYSADIYEMIFPKYAKIQFKINKVGNLSLAASPSLTPGVLPEGAKAGFIPKGTKVFDYDQEIILSLTHGDCLNILNFNSTKNVANTVDIFRNSFKYKKKVSLVYMPDEKDPLKPKFATFWFNYSDNENKEFKFKLPISLSSMGEITKVVESYVNNYAMIKLFCMSDLQE